ncbi:MAG: YbaY family lipoprotein [Pseudomonadota bacterium]
MRFTTFVFLFSALLFAPTAERGARAQADTPAVSGTVTYLDRARLPPDAVLEVQLLDISLADAPAKVLASQTVAPLAAPPYAFRLPYAADAIDDRHTYSVSARITQGERLVMISDTVTPVLTNGAPATDIEVRVIRVSGDGARDAPQGQVLTAPGLRLPATYRGTLPMASGPGAAWHLDLWPDQVFHLTQSFDGADPQSDIGRWSADPARGAIVLQGGREAPVYLEPRGNGDLRLMDRAGQAIESDLPYTLSAGPLEPAEVALPMGGLFRYMADAALFEECLTGRSYPVAMEGAYIDAERGYLALDGLEAGAPVFAVLEGRLAMRPAMEGPDRMHLVIERFSRFAPDQSCDRNRAAASLTNTYWRILQIGGTPIDPVEGTREPHILLRGGAAGAQASYNGTVGCNVMRGTYEMDGASLKFGPAAVTLMACPPPLDVRERALGAALAATTTWQVNGTTLELFDADGSVVVLGEAVYLP